MPIVIKIQKREYTLEDFKKVLNDYPLSWPFLWFKALRNSNMKKSEDELIKELVDEANTQKYNLPPYFALFTILSKRVFNDWKRIECKYECTLDEIELGEIELDKLLMQIYRNEIIKRDKFQCQICGKLVSFNTAHVHHISPRRKFYSKDKVSGPSLYLNLITLCKYCHNKIHKKSF